MVITTSSQCLAVVITSFRCDGGARSDALNSLYDLSILHTSIAVGGVGDICSHIHTIEDSIYHILDGASIVVSPASHYHNQVSIKLDQAATACHSHRSVYSNIS